MADKQDQVKDALKRLLAQPGIASAALVRRDGIAVEVAGQAHANPETFGAMSAVAFGATETAMLEVKDTRLVQILAEGEGQKMVTVGATPELLLVVAAEATAKWEVIVPKVREAAKALAHIVG